MTSPAGPHTRRRTAPPGGAPYVVAHDEQSAVPIDVEHLAELALAVLRVQGVSGPAELSLTFVDDDTIGECNRQFLDGDGPTDVLAFPIDPLKSDGDGPGVPRLLGDVLVCPAVAEHQAAERGGRTDDELALLVVHGVLHVLGMDHAEAGEAATMQARERDLLASFHHRAGR